MAKITRFLNKNVTAEDRLCLFKHFATRESLCKKHGLCILFNITAICYNLLIID